MLQHGPSGLLRDQQIVAASEFREPQTRSPAKRAGRRPADGRAKRRFSLASSALLALSPLNAVSDQPRNGTHLSAVDVQLERVLNDIRHTRIDAALSGVDRLIARHPNFRLAHLLRGDLLLAHTRPIARIGDTGHGASDRLAELREEAHARLQSYVERPPPDVVPRYLLQLDERQKYAIVVDGRRSRLYVYENGNGWPHLVGEYYTTVGRYGIEKTREGDKKTPIGVYHVTSQIPGSKLPDLYGWGAFPINYPNAWDRRLGKTGYGIWLHGVPSENYSRAPRASDGCLALANPDIEALGKYVQPGLTPVVIAERVEWAKPEAWRGKRDLFRHQLERWRLDWESLDPERYFSHYSSGFRSKTMDLAAWRKHKGRVNSAKRWIKVSINYVSIFRSPGRQSRIVVTFDQDYRSSNYRRKTRKEQYWIFEDGRWKIAYEAPVRRPRLTLPESFPGKR